MDYVWEEIWAADPYNRVEERRSRARRRLRAIEQYLETNVDLGEVTEIGCGDGSFASCLVGSSKLRLSSYIGYDLSPTALARASHGADGAQTRFVQADVSKFDFPPQSIDSAIALGVLEHLARPEALLAKLSKAIRPKGRIIITTSNIFSTMYLKRRMREFIGEWPYGYQRNYTPRGFENLLAQHFSRHISSIMQGDWDFPMATGLDKMANLFNRDFGRYIIFIGQPRV